MAENTNTLPEMSAERLTSQLNDLPAIIGRLGLSVANAQRALNADYTESLKELAAVIGGLLPKGTSEDKKKVLTPLLLQLAPCRYQFTETTIDFSADLSESLKVGVSGSLGAGFGAVVINAGASVGYGRDYRAAARIKTILSAIPADKEMAKELIDRADAFAKSGVALPPLSGASKTIQSNLSDIQQLTGDSTPKLTPLQQVKRSAFEAGQFKESADASKNTATTESADAKTAATDVAKKDLVAAKAHVRLAKAAAADAENFAKAAKVAADAAKAAKDLVATSDTAAANTAVGEATTAATAAAEAAATAATKALSTPPDRPSSTLPKPVLRQ